jgi:hypothetical protein
VGSRGRRGTCPRVFRAILVPQKNGCSGRERRGCDATSPFITLIVRINASRCPIHFREIFRPRPVTALSPSIGVFPLPTVGAKNQICASAKRIRSHGAATMRTRAVAAPVLVSFHVIRSYAHYELTERHLRRSNYLRQFHVTKFNLLVPCRN